MWSVCLVDNSGAIVEVLSRGERELRGAVAFAAGFGASSRGAAVVLPTEALNMIHDEAIAESDLGADELSSVLPTSKRRFNAFAADRFGHRVQVNTTPYDIEQIATLLSKLDRHSVTIEPARSTRRAAHASRCNADEFTRMRTRESLRRLLTAIDLLSCSQFGFDLHELWARVTEATGVRVHVRTIHRDLQLLESLSFIERTSNRWRLSTRSTNLQDLRVDRNARPTDFRQFTDPRCSVRIAIKPRGKPCQTDGQV